MGTQSEPDGSIAQFQAEFKREVAEIITQRRAGVEPAKPSPTAATEAALSGDTQIRTGDLEQTLDLLEGLQRILTSFHREQRGRTGPDRLMHELVAIDSHGDTWESLRNQGGAGEGWADVTASIAELRVRLLDAYDEAAR